MPKLLKAMPTEPRRDERLAVNAFDIARLDPATLAKLLGGRLDHEARIDLRDGDAKSTDVALEFHCPLLEAALVVDALRDLDRRTGDRPTRVYLKRRGWTRLPTGQALSTPDGRLNPRVFPAEVSEQQLGALAPAPRRIKLGR